MNKEIKDINQIGWGIRMLNPSEEMIKESEKHIEVYKLIDKVLSNYKPQSEEEQNYKENSLKIFRVANAFNIKTIDLIKYFLSSLENIDLNIRQLKTIIGYLLWIMTVRFYESPYKSIVKFAIEENDNMFLAKNKLKDYINSQSITVNLDDEELCKSIVEGFNKEYINIVLNSK